MSHNPEIRFEVCLLIFLKVALSQNSFHPHVQLVLQNCNHLDNNENITILELLQRISNHFQRIVSTHTSSVVAYSDLIINLYDYFVSKAGLLVIKLSKTTNV